MKKFLFLISILFLIPLISAVEINMKDTFSQSETLTVKILGNFYESISDKNIVFYKGHVRTSIVPTVGKIDDKFYVYAQLLDKESNNYSLVIEGAKYFEGSQIIEEDIAKNFSISENKADFSIDKGFIIKHEWLKSKNKIKEKKRKPINKTINNGANITIMAELLDLIKSLRFFLTK